MNTVLGTGWAFPPEFKNKGQDVQLVSDEIEIKQALEILFTTANNERLYRFDYGCDLNKFIFEEVNQGLATEIQSMILDAIYNYEPRIGVQNISITESERALHVLLIEIDYVILETNVSQNMVYPLSIY